MSISSWAFGGIAALAAPFAIGWLRKKSLDLPNLALGFAADEWHKYVTDHVDESTKRLFARCVHAAFQWAEDEMPEAVGADKMDAVITELEALPVAGAIVHSNHDAVRDLLEGEYQAWKAKVGEEAKKSGQL